MYICRDNLNSGYTQAYHPWNWHMQVPFHCSQMMQNISHDIKYFQMKGSFRVILNWAKHYSCWIPSFSEWMKHIRKVILITELKIEHTARLKVEIRFCIIWVSLNSLKFNHWGCYFLCLISFLNQMFLENDSDFFEDAKG